MVHGAVYDAVNAIAGCPRPYVSSPPAKRGAARMPPSRPRRVMCSSTAGLGVPAERLPVIEAAYLATLLPIPDGPAKAGGIATGEAAAIALLAARAGDGRFGPFRFTESTAVGAWRLAPGAPWTITPGCSLVETRTPRMR